MLRLRGKQERQQHSHSTTLSEVSMSSDLYGEVLRADGLLEATAVGL